MCWGVIYSFIFGLGLVKYVLDQGWCFGFNGIMMFNKVENVWDIVCMVFIEQILLEIDLLFLILVFYCGCENVLFYILFVVEKIVEVKELLLDQVLVYIYQNSICIFFNIF